MAEYQCVYLSEKYKMAHEDDAEILFESYDLGAACGFIMRKFQEEGKDIAVYQPRHGTYRSHYMKPSRDEKGRFTQR